MRSGVLFWTGWTGGLLHRTAAVPVDFAEKHSADRGLGASDPLQGARDDFEVRDASFKNSDHEPDSSLVRNERTADVGADGGNGPPTLWWSSSRTADVGADGGSRHDRCSIYR